MAKSNKFSIRLPKINVLKSIGLVKLTSYIPAVGVGGNQSESVAGSYGSILSTATTTAQIPGVTPVLLTGFDEDGISSSDIGPDHSVDKIAIGSLRAYEVSAQFSFYGTNSAEFIFELYRDLGGTPVATGIKAKRTLGSAGAVGSCSFVGLASLSVGEIIGVYISGGGASDSITIAEAQLVVKSVD